MPKDIRDLTPSQLNRMGLSSILVALSDSDEKAVIALYHNKNYMCTKVHNKLWGRLY